MRKLSWIFIVFMVLAAIGNLIGGTDTPVTGAIPRSGDVPANSGANIVMYVSASALNLRETPSLNARILAKLPRNTRVSVGEQRSGWLLVSALGKVGWVSRDYLSTVPLAPGISVPSQQRKPQRVVRQSGPSCPPRKYCRQIASCSEAVYYFRNCSWGGALDGDNDGVPCESICR
jgi:uncharacterized protein YgiM (DUF1202 family)